ncbi:hypothetical protein FGO68_gene9190 [Halteria grandinella]|uniref:J domain-containing protein n=1 Tax=Halteria grandinella TaxID=5974 RepID=A0A8J8NJ00_HALGN|nr:hypothetical protein FGO68_gene9190 [Halteria grandinella]
MLHQSSAQRMFSSSIPQIEKCFYKTLEVKKDANHLEIKEAYLRKAREFHPDKNPEALEYFTQCTKAYETLIDDQKRAAYDEESITDEEYFTIRIGPIKINLFTVAMISCVGAFSYYVYYLTILKPQQDKNNCPIDHKEFMKQMNQKKEQK